MVAPRFFRPSVYGRSTSATYVGTKKTLAKQATKAPARQTASGAAARDGCAGRPDADSRGPAYLQLRREASGPGHRPPGGAGTGTAGARRGSCAGPVAGRWERGAGAGRDSDGPGVIGLLAQAHNAEHSFCIRFTGSGLPELHFTLASGNPIKSNPVFVMA